MKNQENITLAETIEQLITGRVQISANLEVIPLFSKAKPKTKYLTLKEGLETGKLRIIEKNISGEVPELKVINDSNYRILLIDGEELYGAKQNRILNTSILLKKKSETLIPVSCTESGRWSYQTDRFTESSFMASPRLRKKKTDAVSESLGSIGEFRSDQREVWDEVDNLFFDLPSAKSSTRAMRDVYEHKKDDMKNYFDRIHCLEKQQGLIIRINGRITGMEYLSSPRAFKHIFDKLIKSYALEAELKKAEAGNAEYSTQETVESFLQRLEKAKVTVFKSPGHGYDLRISGKDLTGNALRYKGEVIHLAAFDNVNSERSRRYRNRMF